LASWSIEYTRRADKDLQSIDKPTRVSIIKAVGLLAGDPPQGNFGKLTAQKGRWRLKLGDWRVIYERDKDKKVYVILRVLRRTSTTY
jgi:mRNA-degrading endonuclease RelE of RelBE toxin-antitoxin system